MNLIIRKNIEKTKQASFNETIYLKIFANIALREVISSAAPSDLSMSEEAWIEPKAVATFASAARRFTSG